MLVEIPDDVAAAIELLIDNNVNFINPALLRSVLYTIAGKIPGPSSLDFSADSPLYYDVFTNKFNISQASPLTDGFLSKEDYLSFSSDTAETPDATSDLKGKIKLSGDLSGSADAPTVPGLLQKKDSFLSNFVLKFFKNYFTDLSGFSITGFTPTTTNGKLIFSSGTGNFSKFITVDGLKNTDENIEIEVIFKAVTVDATSYGIGIGKKSLNSWYKASICAHFSPAQNTAYLWDPETSTQIANKVTSATVSGDIIKLKYSQIANNVFVTYYNLTQGTSGQISIVGNLSVTKNFKIPNSSDICIWNFGGTMEIISIKQTSFSYSMPDILCIGDSKTVGYSSNSNSLRWASNINSLGTVIVSAGDGDRTLETTQTIAYSKTINAKYAILCIGRNDLASGVSSATWQLNYQNIVTQLEEKETVVIHLLPIPETTLSDQSSLKNWIITTYGIENTIDPSVGWDNSIMLSADNVHPNEIGHQFIAKKILDSGLIIAPNNITVLPKINEVDNLKNQQVINSNNYVPYANSGNLLDSEIFRLAANKYGQGSNSPYDFGTGFGFYQVYGVNYGLLGVGKIGVSRRFYFSTDGVNGFLGVNNAGTNVNCMTLFVDGGIQFKEEVDSTSKSPSAKIQIDSTTKGFLTSRMTNAQRLAISSPAIGLIVYCTDSEEGLYIYKSTGYAKLSTNKDLKRIPINTSNSTYTITETKDATVFYDGTTTTTILPALSSAIGSELILVNGGSGNLTVNSNAGGSDIWSAGTAVISTTVLPTDSIRLVNNGTYWLIIK